MGNYLSLAAMTAVWQYYLQEALHNCGQLPGAVVTTRRPEALAKVTETTVNIFLYQVTPNPNERNNDLPTREPLGEGRVDFLNQPRAALDLYYLLSFTGDGELFHPQQLLGAVISAMQARPIFSPAHIGEIAEKISNPYLHKFINDSGLSRQPFFVTFTMLPMNLEALSRLWSVFFFQTPYFLSIVYEARLVIIDADETVTPSRTVEEVDLAVGPYLKARDITKNGDQIIVSKG